MANTTKKIMKTNGFGDVIMVLKGMVEEISLPIEKIDIIISKWMGYFLLFENIPNTILYA